MELTLQFRKQQRIIFFLLKTEQSFSSEGSQGTEANQIPDVVTEPTQGGSEPLKLNMQQGMEA